jgi:hypothetical protein
MADGLGPLTRIHGEFATQAARAREQAQSVPRPARIRFSVKTTGAGESRMVGPKAINFLAFMLEEPTFTWGVQAAQTIAPGDLPLCTAIVLRYIKNGNGLYTGAELGFVVDSENPNVRLKFSLTFEGSTLRSTSGTGTGTLDAPRSPAPLSAR